MTEERLSNVFTIAPGVPFLTTLVNAVRSGAFKNMPAADRSDPLALASTTIYVPTRRAARQSCRSSSRSASLTRTQHFSPLQTQNSRSIHRSRLMNGY
jgi:hypothetical protein